ncbi:17036_t:CDS:2, partial [Cetraspora pellucida]
EQIQLIGFMRDEVVIMYSDKTKKFFNFQIVESSKDMINLKSEDANMIKNDYKEKVDEIYKGKINYEAEKEVDEMYKEDIERQTR